MKGIVAPTSKDDPATWEPVADSVLARLREAILRGELPAGAKISEPEIARQYGVSRAPLREAIRRLEERGLLTRTPRLGARVVVLSSESVRQIFMVREAMEGLAASEAARHITDEEIRQLRIQLDLQRKRTAEIDVATCPAMEPANDFHEAIVRASRNAYLIKFLCEDYRDLIELCRQRQRSMPNRTSRASVEHLRIVDALEDRDPELAEIMMRRHIAAARRELESDL